MKEETNNRKTKHIKCRLTPDEYLLVKAKAADTDSLLSEYFRYCLFSKEIEVIHIIPDIERIKEYVLKTFQQVQKIGINYNQLVTQINTLTKQNNLQNVDFLIQKSKDLLQEAHEDILFQKLFLEQKLDKK
jgi:hypothetical protein